MTRTITPPVAQAARWTLAQYEQLVDTGLLEGRRVELIAGIITEMSPASNPHDACVSITADWARERLGRSCYVREEKGVDLPDNESVPEPDIVVCARRRDFYAHAKPQPEDVVLLAEVAASSLNYDRRVKAPLYAAAGIPEYWTVNLVDRQLEVYLPGDEVGAYAEPQIYREGDRFEHALLGSVAVADLLPMRSEADA